MTFEQKTFRTLYKKLLALYPQAFREQFGESMEQTFNDLCRERKQQSGQGLFGFVLWMFIETSIGIIKEHLILIKKGETMENIMTSLKSAAIIGFLIVLPFMLLNFMFVIVKRLNFDLRDALDSIVTFGFLWLGVAAIILILMPIVRNIRAGNNIVANPVSARGNTKKNILTNPKPAAIISFILALPFLTILSLLLLHLEPPFAHLLNNPDPDQPDVIGTLIVLGAFLLAVLACIIARAPIARTMQAGGGLFAHPINLVLAIVILSFITRLVIGLIVDQFPCWIGVPNCD